MIRSLFRIGLAATLAIATVLASTTSADASDGRIQVLIKDECDPATFNAAPPVGPGLGKICQGDGDVTFSEFIAELQEDRAIDEWAFDPDELDVVAGRSVVIKNVGGETHTFTRVARFGPGFVPPLNQLVFGVAGPPIPEFTAPFGPGINFVPSGGRLTLATGPGTQLVLGKNRIQCGIHPWMRAVIKVGSAD